jgi:hypothetical protein
VWALKLTPEWVGTEGKTDLPLPDNVRRYYIASTTHGGGAGGFDSSLPGVGLATTGAVCPGNNFGTAVLPGNPMPHAQTVNALRAHFRSWVMRGTPPPPSRYPLLANGTLARADKASLGFPTLPGLRATVPEPDFIVPVLDYDWGPEFNAVDGSGIPSLAPPRIKRVLDMFAPTSTRMATSGAACPWYCWTRPWGPTWDGTSPRMARCRSTGTRSATTSAA